MATCKKNEITDWKRLWQLVSGIHYETPVDTVLDELMNVSKELQDGIMQFKPKDSSTVGLGEMLEGKNQEKLLPFTQQLQDLLFLESKQCWELLCFYLTNEYRGSASLLTSLISTEASMTKLLHDIWGYYTLERMIVLKIVKNLLIFYNVPNHSYQSEYKKVVDSISLNKLRDSYIEQLEYLIEEQPPTKLLAGEFFNYQTKLAIWSERNAREINEVLHILLLICEHLPADCEQTKRLLKSFRQHGFGTQQRYFDSTNNFHKELITRLSYSEVMLFLKCLQCVVETGKQINETVKSLDTEIAEMYHKPEHGPLLFAWMLLRMNIPDESRTDESTLRSRKFGQRSLELNCFAYMHGIVSHAMFKDNNLVSRIVRKTIFTLLGKMCDIFDADGSCGPYPYIYELLCELLSWPALAKDFCNNEDSGVRSLYTTLLENFPIHFVHLSTLASALSKAGMGAYIKSQLETLPIFTDHYDETKYTLRSQDDEEYVLMEDLRPYKHMDFTITAGSTAVIIIRNSICFAHFRTSVNYFNVLHHEINCLLSDTMRNDNRICRVSAGLKYLDAVLQQTKSLSGISTEMVHPTEMCIDILNKFKTVQNPPLELMANCLRVCTALLPLADTEILTRVFNLNVLPIVINETLDDYKQYANGVSFDSRVLGAYLVDVENKEECYDFLLAYLNLLRSHAKLYRCNRFFQMEIPGLIFLLREVFPHLHAWRFQTQTIKNKIFIEIMGFICDILDAVSTVGDEKSSSECSSDELVTKHLHLLRNICVYSLLNLENGLMILRFVGMGNAYLQHTMEMESDWMLPQSHSFVMQVRLAMRILMQLLRMKHTVFADNDMSPLEALIYTQPKQRDTLRIISVVTSYMSNIFDRWLPILACRLLKRISMECNMSLLACLDMEPDQIRLTFLQKLPDEYESDSLKLAILELIDACIEKQPGMTTAFFKVDYPRERSREINVKGNNAQIADSIVTYMEDCLDAIAAEPQIIEHVLPAKIISLLHSLWKFNMQSLVGTLVRKPNFWHKLCTPFFSKRCPNLRIYTQLLNILAIEVFYTNKPDVECNQIVLEFFDEKNFGDWLNYFFDMPKIPLNISPVKCDEMPDWLCRLQSFKDFIIILLKKQPQFIEIPAEQFKLLAEKCLIVLVDRAEYIHDLRPFILLSELYLFIMLNYKHSYTKTQQEEREFLQQILLLLSRVASCYEDLHVRAKEAVVSIAIKSAQLHADELLGDSDIALGYLNSVVSMICTELQNLENCVRMELHTMPGAEEIQTTSSTNSVVLSLSLLKTMATVFHNEGPGNWDLPFVSNRVFQRLLSCTSSILQIYTKQSLSIQLLDVLIVFAKGHCSAEFLHCDVAHYLWLKLLPPRELLQSDYSYGKPREDVWIVQKWWPIYSRGMELVTILFEKHSNYFLHQTLQFIGVHEEYLVDSLLLGKQSLEPLAMNLIKSAMTLVASVSAYNKQWRLDHPQSLFKIMRAVQMLLGHSIDMFHQPKNLKDLIDGRRSQLHILREHENNELVDDVITAFNDLTEIIILCVQSMQHFSPNLTQSICDPVFETNKYEPIFEIHFGAPTLHTNAVSLTFGTVLSIVGVFTKALNLQNYGFHERPLNILPTDVDNDDFNGSSMRANNNNTTVSNPYSTQRNFSKSLSTASASSTACPPNELLSNLDGELCLLALEHILMLAASQSILTLRNPDLAQREKQIIKREISAELLSFHEFLRRKVLMDFREHKSMCYRRKHGQLLMTSRPDSLPVEEVTPAPQARNPTDSSRHHSTDLRVNVVRRLHLQQQQQQQQTQRRSAATSKTKFEMSHIISPISRQEQPSTSADAATAISSTPIFQRPSIRRQSEQQHDEQDYTKRAHFDDDDDENIQCLPVYGKETGALSYVQFVEEDYLHIMSNLFTVICQIE